MVDVMDAQFDKLTTKLDAFTYYFGRGNDLTQRLLNIVERQVVAIERRNDLLNEQINVMRQTSTVQYSESDIWEMLVRMNLPDEQIMVQCYDWLCNNPSHVRRLFGLPPHLRLNQFLKLMGASMASVSRPTRKRTSMDRKGKGTTTSDAAPRSRLPPIESVLNYRRFFSNREQMVTYGLGFHHRVVLAPKLMDFPYFASSGLYFHHHLEFQGSKHFVAMSSSYFEDLIKVFYSNLRVSEAGYLYSEVNKTKIKMKPADWLIVPGLKYEGHKLSFTNMPEDIEYDRDTTLASMIRLEMQGRNVRNVGSLNINDRLLHYVYVHILAPRSSNFAQLLQEDIFMLWAIKNNMLINWPHFIMEHMIKCRDNEMPLPYAILITHIMSHYGVDLSIAAAIELGWPHCFYKKTLKKLNVVNVNGVWQHGRVNQDDGQNAEDEDQPMPEEHVADIGPQSNMILKCFHKFEVAFKACKKD
ncbi:hypothetical protein Fmac_009072 [Flemingia macrophylla]|uniref:Putative plant transposon protein domain-containing protein n=1 Tax=Flemingia macrophylla TaxID=520843 RepID=A0ABD1N025_9FABA